MQTLGGYFHIYNRGAHKAPIFLDASDYQRFSQLLYLANDTDSLIYRRKNRNYFTQQRKQLLVNIFCYCLMPNHFHIGLVQIVDRGIEKFMRKFCTAYVMYYNRKYNHSGTLFQGKYKWKQVETEKYLSTLIEYIHLNPFGIDEPTLTKETQPEYYSEAIKISLVYEYSSFKDYLKENRPQSVILTPRSDLGIILPIKP